MVPGVQGRYATQEAWCWLWAAGTSLDGSSWSGAPLRRASQGEGSGEDLGYKLAGGWRQHLLAPFWKTVVHWPACAGGGWKGSQMVPQLLP